MTIAPDFFDTEPRNWRARLAVSVEVMRELSRYSDPQEMYAVFTRRMAQLFPVSRQLSISRRGLRFPQYRVTRFNLWTDPVNPWKESHRLPVHEGGLLAELLYADQPQVIEELALEVDDPANAYLAGQRSLLAIPHFDQGTAQNMVILAREDADAFPRDRIADLVLLGNLFARATQTLVLSQAAKEAYDAVDYELRSIADIQKSLLPSSTPKVPGLDVAVHYQTAKRAGGDYYDFFPLPGGRLGVLIADASGHGAPAAVLMAVAHSIAHAQTEPLERPGEFLTQLNSHLTRQYTRQTGNFMTAFYARLRPRQRIADVCQRRAQPAPPRSPRRRPDWRSIARSDCRSASSPTRSTRTSRLQLRAGDQAVFFTDGVIEAVNGEGDVFGSDRIDAALRVCPPSAERLIQTILRELTAFTAGVPVADDRTLVVVKRYVNY